MTAYTAEECQRINSLGEKLREGFDQAFMQQGIRGQATGVGSLTNLHFYGDEISDSRHAMKGMIDGGHISRLLHLTMLRHGVMSATRLMYCTSTAMKEAHVDQAVNALNESLAELRPYIEAERPGLLAA